MGTLTINGKSIPVDDSFAKLSPADQQKTVNEISAKLGTAGANVPANVPANASPDVRALLQAQATMPRSQPPTPQQQVDSAIEAYRMADHPEMTVPDFTKRFNDTGMNSPLSLPQLAQNDQLFGFGDEINGAASGLAAAMAGKDFGKNYDAGQRLQDARRNLGLQQGGVPAQVASVVGQLTSLGAAAPGAIPAAATTRLGKLAQTAKGLTISAGTGAAMGGVQGFGSANGDFDQRLQAAGEGAGAGAMVGAAAPLVVRAIAAPLNAAARGAAMVAAVKGAPSAGELASAASQMFTSAKSSGVAVTPQKFSQTVADLIQNATKRDIDPDLDGAAVTVYRRAAELAQEGATNPSALSLSRLHNLRQKAQDVAMEPGAKDRTKRFAQDLIDGLDNMIGNLKPNEITVPPGAIGTNSGNAGNMLLDGISTWAKAKKVGLLETAISKAENYVSGTESGLRNQFRSILNGKNARLFTDLEKEAMRKVVNGTMTVKALQAAGIFKGMGSAMLGGTVGAAMGPWGALVGAASGGALGALSKMVTEAATQKAAQQAARIVASPTVPLYTAPRPLPWLTTFPLVANDQQQQRH